MRSEEMKSSRVAWKRWLFRIGALLGALALAGFLLAASGLIPIKASSGHWAITRWFLNFSKQRSVATHTLFMKAPALDEPSLVVKGAGYYETGCRPCHGSPGLPQPRIAQRMLPVPPNFAVTLPNRDASELFHIVKHGIKLTGMPAWPSPHRDDEVWAMVAFLRRFPQLDAENYRRLASGEITPAESSRIEHLLPPEKAPQAVSQTCGRCHGLDGLGRGLGAFPKLAGQKPDYLLASLDAYARGKRHSGIMEPIAAGLSAEGMRELAVYYGELPRRATPSARTQTTERIERGKTIASAGIPKQGVPACIACHGPGATPRNPHYPALAGQYADYLVLQLQLFSKEQRGGTEYSHLMHFVAGRLSPEQLRDVALYYESLAWTRELSPP